MPDEFYTLKEIARKYKVTRGTIKRWITAGKFPKPDISMGGTRRWSTQTIDKWDGGAKSNVDKS